MLPVPLAFGAVAVLALIAVSVQAEGVRHMNSHPRLGKTALKDQGGQGRLLSVWTSKIDAPRDEQTATTLSWTDLETGLPTAHEEPVFVFPTARANCSLFSAISMGIDDATQTAFLGMRCETVTSPTFAVVAVSLREGVATADRVLSIASIPGLPLNVRWDPVLGAALVATITSDQSGYTVGLVPYSKGQPQHPESYYLVASLPMGAAGGSMLALNGAIVVLDEKTRKSVWVSGMQWVESGKFMALAVDLFAGPNSYTAHNLTTGDNCSLQIISARSGKTNPHASNTGSAFGVRRCGFQGERESWVADMVAVDPLSGAVSHMWPVSNQFSFAIGGMGARDTVTGRLFACMGNGVSLSPSFTIFDQATGKLLHTAKPYAADGEQPRGLGWVNHQ